MANKKFQVEFDSITVEHIGDVLLMRMHGGSKNQSVFNPTFASNFNKALAYVKRQNGKKALVLTGTHRFFSAGLDLKYVGRNFENLAEMSIIVSAIFKELLLLSMPSVAAINGSCFGAGAFLAMCCDWRIMKAECGRVCFPLVRHGLDISNGWRELLSLKLPPQTLRTCILTGKEWTAADALKAQIIDQELDNSFNFQDQCVAFAEQLLPFAHNRSNYSRIKNDLYYSAAEGFDKHTGMSKL